MEYDLFLAWNWEYDADFVQQIDGAVRQRGGTIYQVILENLDTTRQAYQRGEMRCKTLFDRASDTDERFLPLVHLIMGQPTRQFNRHDLARRYWNKMTCHLEFITAGLHTPYTIIIPSYHEQPHLEPADLSPLGSTFNIKPAHGGGGEGVITCADTWEQVLAARRQYPDDQYLLQAHILPVYIQGREAWFRMLYCCGRSYPCWWDTQTHVYTPVTLDDEVQYNLSPLHSIANEIARLTGLDIFSTEVTLTAEGQLVVIDYVNDPLDLRLQSKAVDGIPDAIIIDIISRLADIVTAR